MSQKIHKLDEDLINKIAAGEVVERPASVVKELVENSLDAGSTQITVSIRDGGKKLIQVTDNGSGIAPNELELAISRHATSKIKKFDDLYELGTKGFRGEALASVGSVAQLTVASKTADAPAAEIIVHAGQIIDQRECAQPLGTTVAVKYLFYQTPARLKFLRTRETEASHVEDVLTKMALSHHHVEFRLYHDDKLIFNAPVCEDPKDRLNHILGKDLSANLYPFFEQGEKLSVSGYFCHPATAIGQRSHAYFFVNSRAVSDKVLWHAVSEAYRDLLMKGKYPVMVLDLHIDEKLVDVNVHPAKSEVRFHQSQVVHAFVKDSLRRHLLAAPWQEKHAVAGDALSTDLDVQRFESQNLSVGGNQLETSRMAVGEGLKDGLNQWSRDFFSGRDDGGFGGGLRSGASLGENREWKMENGGGLSSQRQIQFGKTPYAQMNPIGQFMGTYIVCESGDRLVLIDQHAAHERVGFEKLMQQFAQSGILSEPLLVPETFELKPSDAEILKKYTQELLAFGFEIEPFGGNTFVLKATPVMLKGKIDFKMLIVSVVEDIKASGELGSLKDKLHHVLATMACHAQIRANHHLERQEISALLKELEHYQFTDFCPHGRPVCIEVTKEEIEKWFRRVL